LKATFSAPWSCGNEVFDLAVMLMERQGGFLYFGRDYLLGLSLFERGYDNLEMATIVWKGLYYF